MTDGFQHKTTVVGTMHVIDGTGVVRMEDHFDTDAADLWSALTDPERLARWIGDVRGELVLDGQFHARFTSSWEGPGRVDVCERPTRLQVTLGLGTDEQTVVEAVLSAEGDRTRLVIEERGLPTDDLAAYGAGWQAHVEDLGALLAGTGRTDWHDRWTALVPAYRQQQPQSHRALS